MPLELNVHQLATNSLIKQGLLHVRVEVLHFYFTIPLSAIHLENFHLLNTPTGLSLEGIFSCEFLSSTDLHIQKNPPFSNPLSSVKNHSSSLEILTSTCHQNLVTSRTSSLYVSRAACPPANPCQRSYYRSNHHSVL